MTNTTTFTASNTTAPIISSIKLDPGFAATIHFALVGNTTFYLNNTDGHYHLKGIIQNISHVTISHITMSVSFYDKMAVLAGNVRLVMGSAIDNINPGDMPHFDIDTGSTAKQANQFQYLLAMIGMV
jgi:hypothetical protein